MGAIIPLLLPLIGPLIQGVESIFKAKPKSGADKVQAVINALLQVVNQMMNAGVQVEGQAIPPIKDDLLKGAIETELARLKASGQLGVTPASGTLYLVQGKIVPLQVL